MSFEETTLKAVNTKEGSGFPERPEPFSPGQEKPDPSQRETLPQNLNLEQAASKNFVKVVQNPSTGNTNYVINHGRLHANGYRLFKEGKEVRSRVISKNKENLYTIQADEKLIAGAPSTVKDDFSADPTSPQQQAQPPSRTALEEAKDYVDDLVQQGLLGDNVDQQSVENYAKALAGMLPLQADGTDPNQISVEMLKNRIEENSGSEVASALFNIDPDDPNHVDIEGFIQQIRQKRSLEEQTGTGEPREEQENPKEVEEKLKTMSEWVLPMGFIVHDVEDPSELRNNKNSIVQDQGLQYYESLGYGFVNAMLGVQLKHLNVPVSDYEDFFSAVSAKDNSGNFIHFDFVKTTYMKLGYSAASAAKKAEYYLNLVNSKSTKDFAYLEASGLATYIARAINCYNGSDSSISADDLYKLKSINPSEDKKKKISGSSGSVELQTEDEPEDVNELEKTKVLELKAALHEQYLTDEELEYGILHILTKPIGYKYLTLDMDRVDHIISHISKKLILAMKNDGKLEAFLNKLRQVDVYTVEELYGKFDIQPSSLKHIDTSIEEAKETLFDLIKSVTTGPKIEPEETAELINKINLAKIRVQVLQDLKSTGMKAKNFDKEEIKEFIENRRRSKLESQMQELIDWAMGDVQPDKDYPMITDSGVAERQQQLGVVFSKASDVKHASYRKLKDLHKKQAYQIGQVKSATERGVSMPKAPDDELLPEVSGAVESAIQGKDLNILKLSSDMIYEINNSFNEMSQLEENSPDLETKRKILEKFLNSRGMSPAGAKSAADAVLNVVKGKQPGSKGSSPAVAEANQEPQVQAIQKPEEELSPEKILKKLEAANIRKIPKSAQANIEKLKSYLEVNNVELSDMELQELFKYFNPPAPQFSFEEYVKRNPNLITSRNNKFFIKIGNKEIPLPENIRDSEEAIAQFIEQNKALEEKAKIERIEAAKNKVLQNIERIDSIGKLKRQDRQMLIQQLIDAGMSDGEATAIVDSMLSAKRPVLEAKVQAKLKGLENSSKVRNIFMSDGNSLTSDEISANFSGLVAAVYSEISDFYMDDNQARVTAEKIVNNKLQEATNIEKINKLDESLGIKAKNGKPGNSGELDLAINGVSTKVKVRKTEDGYVFSSDAAEIEIPREELLKGNVDYDLIAQQLEAMSPKTVTKLDENSPDVQETTPELQATPVKVKNGKLSDVASVASGIVGSILSGKPVRLSASLSGLDENSWFALSDAIAKSKTFKKLKLPSSAADDIVFKLTNADPKELEFDLSEILKPESETTELKRDEFGNVIRKSSFSVWTDFLTKSLSNNEQNPDQQKKFAYEMIITEYIDNLKMAQEFDDLEKAKIRRLLEDLESRGLILDNIENMLND